MTSSKKHNIKVQQSHHLHPPTKKFVPLPPLDYPATFPPPQCQHVPPAPRRRGGRKRGEGSSAQKSRARFHPACLSASSSSSGSPLAQNAAGAGPQGRNANAVTRRIATSAPLEGSQIRQALLQLWWQWPRGRPGFLCREPIRAQRFGPTSGNPQLVAAASSRFTSEKHSDMQ